MAFHPLVDTALNLGEAFRGAQNLARMISNFGTRRKGGGGASFANGSTTRPLRRSTRGSDALAIRNTLNETRIHDEISAGTLVAKTSGNLHNFCAITIGNSSSTRLGNNILLRSLQVDLIRRFSNQSADGNWLRFLVVHDKNPAGQAPTKSDILTPGTPAGGGGGGGNIGTNIWGRRRIATIGRFTIMRDWITFCPPRTDGFSTGNTQAMKSWYIRVPRRMRRCIYDGTSTIPRSGCFWLVVFSDQEDASTGQRYDYSLRTSFLT